MNFLQTVEADAQAAIQWVEHEVVYLEDEAAKVMAWIQKESPDAAGAIATFLKGAEHAAADLATYSANGLSKVVADGVDGAESTVLNLIQSSGLAQNLQGDLRGITVSGLPFIESMAQKMISVGLAKVLSGVASAATTVITGES